MRTFLLLLSISLCLQTFGQGDSATSRTGSVNLPGSTHVLLLGVSKYANLESSKQLQFAHEDAKLLLNYFQSTGVTDIEILINEEAAKKEVVGQKIHTMIQNAKANDKVIIYFSGHGDYDTIYNKSYLLLHDVEAPTNVTRCPTFSQVLTVNELQELAAVGANRNVKVKLIFDACKSGKIPASDNEKLVCISSCNANENAIEKTNYGHGLFTYFLYKGLNENAADENQDEEISVWELQAYVKKMVSIESNNKQNPQFRFTNDNELMARLIPGNPSLLDTTRVTTFDGTTERSVSSSKKSFNRNCDELISLFNQQLKAGKLVEHQLDSTDQQAFSISNIGKIDLTSKPTNSCSYVANENFYCIANSNAIEIHSSSSQVQKKLLGHADKINVITFSEYDTYLYSGANDRKLIAWNLASSEIIAQKKMSSAIVKICPFAENQVVFNNAKGQLGIWDCKTNKVTKIKSQLWLFNSMIAVNHEIVGVDKSGTIVAFDQENELKSRTINPFGKKIREIVYFKQFNYLIGLTDKNQLLIFDYSSGNLLQELELPFEKITHLVIDEKESILFASSPWKNKTIALKIGSSVLTEQGIIIKFGGRLSYQSKKQELSIYEESGQLNQLTLKFYPNFPLSAQNLYAELGNCEMPLQQLNSYRDQLIAQLNGNVESTISKLVNGDATRSASLQEIDEAILQVNVATELSQGEYRNDTKLVINQHLLEVYKVILEGDAKNYEVAKTKIDKLISMDVNGSYAYNAAALLHQKFSQLKKARQMIVLAEQKAGMWIEPTYNYGVILKEDGDLKGAENKFEKVTKAAPTLEKGINAYIDVLTLQDKKKEADVFSKKAQKQNPKMEIQIPEKLRNYQNNNLPQGKKAPKSTSFLVDTLKIGSYFQGGKIGCIDYENGHLIVVAENDLEPMFWNEAVASCENLVSRDYSDWMLPDYKTLRALSSYKKSLNMNQSAYWSSNISTYANEAVWINFSNEDDIASDYLERNYGVRPIRIVEFPASKK
ncbi:MAG: caspase family protein [Bacteroidota bacterium]